MGERNLFAECISILKIMRNIKYSLNEFLAGEDIEIDNIEKNQKIH